MKICPECHAEMPDTAKFCTKCGHPLLAPAVGNNTGFSENAASFDDVDDDATQFTDEPAIGSHAQSNFDDDATQFSDDVLGSNAASDFDDDATSFVDTDDDDDDATQFADDVSDEQAETASSGYDTYDRNAGRSTGYDVESSGGYDGSRSSSRSAVGSRGRSGSRGSSNSRGTSGNRNTSVRNSRKASQYRRSSGRNGRNRGGREDRDSQKTLSIVLIALICLLVFIGIFFAVKTFVLTKDDEDIAITLQEDETTIAMSEVAEEADTSAAGEGTAAASVSTESAVVETQTVAETTAPEPITLETTVPAEPAIHQYQLVIKDITWSDAYREAVAAGGKLARFETEEEFQYVTDNILNTADARKLKIWIGGTRSLKDQNYHWANADGTVDSSTTVNDGSQDYLWMDGEPSFRDNNLNLDEYRLDMIYRKKAGRWYVNDAPENLIDAVPSYKGTIAYLIELDA